MFRLPGVRQIFGSVGSADIVLPSPSASARLGGCTDETFQLHDELPRRTKGAPFALLENSPLFVSSPRSCGDPASLKLHDAIRGDDTDRVSTMLADDRSLLQSRSKLGRTPLLTAAAAGRVSMVRFLLTCGASVRETDDCRANALYYALRYGTGELIACLLDAGGWEAGVGPISVNEGPALHVASRYNNVAALRHLLLLVEPSTVAGGVNYASAKGTTALHVASAWGSLDAARLLLDYGADPSCRDESSCMPVHIATAPAMTRLLEEEGPEKHVAYLLHKLRYIQVFVHGSECRDMRAERTARIQGESITQRRLETVTDLPWVQIKSVGTDGGKVQWRDAQRRSVLQEVVCHLNADLIQELMDLLEK